MKTEEVMIIARCESCEGVWHLPAIYSDRDPDIFEGVCRDCQAESDAEKPLTFEIAPELPEDFLYDEE